MPGTQPPLVIFDWSVLANFLMVDRLDLLLGLPNRLAITDVVREEIMKDFQLQCLEMAISEANFETISLHGMEDHRSFSIYLDSGLGRSESCSIVAARRYDALLAMDDSTAIKRVRKAHPTQVVATTADLVIMAIQRGSISVHDADSLRHPWAAHHRSMLPACSFGDLI